jgi:AcrR family transcriptional regulator
METSGNPTSGGDVEAELLPAGGAVPSVAAERLPSGPHGIPAEAIIRNQRERLIAAMAEVSAEKGLRAATVRDVVARAGVSSATFYAMFDGLEDCAVETFWELHRRLLDELDVACQATPEPTWRPRAALRRSLELFATDLPAARLLTIEILGAGPLGPLCQHRAIGLTAERIGIGTDAGWGRVALACSLIARRVAAAEAQRLPELERELELVLSDAKGLG